MERVIILQSVFQWKEALKRFSIEADRFTEQTRIRISKKFPKDMIISAGLVFDDMRFQADCKIGKYKRQQEIEHKRKVGSYKLKQCLEISAGEARSYQSLVNEVKLKSEPLLTFLNNYKKRIHEIYQQYAPFLWHVSAVQDLSILRLSLQKENMYYNEVCDAVFATSNFDEILLYSGRVSGEEMAVIGHVCFYKKIPYRSWDNLYLYLKEQAVVYYLDIKDFEPVIDFAVTGQENVILKFGHEWINRSGVSVHRSERAAMIPVKDMSAYRIFYGLKSLCLASYIDDYIQECEAEKKEKYLQKLVRDNIIAFVDA